MTGIMEKTWDSYFAAASGSSVALAVDLSLYEISTVFRACYKFTDQCYFFLDREASEPGSVTVFLTSKNGAPLGTGLVGDFCNELLDQQVRFAVFRETSAIRELIVAQAFAEGNLLDANRDEGDYQSDPLDIGRER